MKAVVKEITKAHHGGKPVIEIDVEYQREDGSWYSSQRYAYEETPDMTLFDQQARSLQNDLDDAVEVAAIREQVAAIEKPVDDQITALRNHFKLDFAEQIPVNDSRR
jgi:hypothetical protein